jgi:WD40 repeat protein
VGLAAAGPIGPSTSHTDIVVSVGFSPGRTLVPGGWDKSVRLWDVATHLARAVLVQPSSWSCGQLSLDPDDADLLPSSSPALPVRLLVNRCGSRRSSGDAHGPCVRYRSIVRRVRDH